MNRSNFLNVRNKFIFLVFIILLFFSFFSASQYEPYDVTEDNYLGWWLDHYHELQCDYSLFETYNSFKLNYEIIIRPESSGDVECFGKNYWVDYYPEKKIEDGWEVYSPKKFVLRVSTNVHIDLILQTIFWITLISFIPKKNNVYFKKLPLTLLLTVCFSYLHLYGEQNYYYTIGRDFSYEFFTQEFDGTLSFSNYYLYSYLLIITFILYFTVKILNNRFENFINYIPFVFLINGTYSSLNLNFYLLIFFFLGVNSVINKQINIRISALYFIFSLTWFIDRDFNNSLIDTDKLRGFINSSNSMTSKFYWTFVFYFLIIGINYLFINFKENFDLAKFSQSFLITSSLIVIIGYLSGVSRIMNFILYYFFGMSKTPMNTLMSIEGNTWRGASPSAEGIGEFYAIAILLFIFTLFYRKNNFKYTQIILLALTIFGLIRSNNAAAIISLILILIIFIIAKNMVLKKYSKLISVGLFLITLSSVGFLIKDYSFQFLSNIMLFEAVNESEVDFDFQLNQNNLSPVDEANYAVLLELPNEETNFSTSLDYLLRSYTFNNKIKNVPSLISTTSSISYFINRSEKWGIFIAKYNPNISELLFGYGPYQLSEYLNNHKTKNMNGLLLPHSSFLNYLIFFGVFGVILLLAIIINFLFTEKNNFSFSLIILFLMINFLKSDSLLYLPNFIIFITFINLTKRRNIEFEK
jgi:hypothetical protein